MSTNNHHTGVGRDEAREARPPRQLPRHDPYRLLQGKVEISLVANSNVVIAFDTFCCAFALSELRSKDQNQNLMVNIIPGKWLRDLEAGLSPCQVFWRLRSRILT